MTTKLRCPFCHDEHTEYFCPTTWRGRANIARVLEGKAPIGFEPPIVDDGPTDAEWVAAHMEQMQRVLREHFERISNEREEKLLDGSLSGLWKSCYDELRTQNSNLTSRLIQQRREIRRLHVRRREDAEHLSAVAKERDRLHKLFEAEVSVASARARIIDEALRERNDARRARDKLRVALQTISACDDEGDWYFESILDIARDALKETE